MILECASCRTRYRLDENRVPESGLLVRCSRCGQVSRAFLPESRSSGASARPIVPAGTVRPAAQALDGGASTGSPDASTVSPPTAPTVEKVDHALREGRFAEEFNAEMEEARRMIRNRFPSLPDAPALFDSAIAQICEKRRAKPLDA